LTKNEKERIKELLFFTLTGKELKDDVNETFQNRQKTSKMVNESLEIYCSLGQGTL
jgi:hypothetical protein